MIVHFVPTSFGMTSPQTLTAVQLEKEAGGEAPAGDDEGTEEALLRGVLATVMPLENHLGN